MGKWWSMLVVGTALASAFASGATAGVVASMVVAGLAGFGAALLHESADSLRARGSAAPATLRLARVCDDAALAACFSALLFATTPFV
ncbi:MAG: hypothetical protein ACKVUT_15135 [Gaiella sp.]